MKKLLSFSFYDFGNSVFPMIIITTLTSSYFVNHVIENQQTGAALWQLIIGLSGILIAFMMPFIGKLSDATNNGRVIYLRFFSIICILSIAAFWFVLPDSNYVLFCLFLLFVGSISYEASNSLYNATLKSCYSKDLSFGSGVGFGTGYVGGVLVLIIILYLFILPEENILGLSKDSQSPIRFSHLILSFWFVLPNSNYVIFCLSLLFLGSISYEASNSLYNATLKSCYSKDLTFGSGVGFGTGYIGGVLVLIIILYLFLLPEENILGLNKENQSPIRFSHLILSFWFLVFCIPLMFFTNLNQKAYVTPKKTTHTIKDLIWDNGLTNTGRYLIARMLYMDGLIIVTTTIGIFGTSVMGISIGKIIIVAILCNISGAIGCYLFGIFFKNDKKTIIITLALLSCVIVSMAVNANQTTFIILAIIGTFFSGPLQSSSRVVMAKLLPNEMQGLGFGMFTFSGKATAFLGPLCAAAITFLFSQRMGFGFSIVLLLSGMILMLKVSYQDN